MTTPTTLRWNDRMNASDTLFWHLDAVPELRSTFGVLMLLDHLPPSERIADEFQRLIAGIPRLRQRVLEVPFNLAPPEWVDDPQFDIDYHLRALAVPAPGGTAELLAELGPLFASPLDRDRPLWEAYRAEGLLDGRGAVFLKVHHCLVDGVGGTQLLTALLAARDGRAGVAARMHPPRSVDLGARLWRAVRHNARELIGANVAIARSVAETLLHPVDTLAALPSVLRRVYGFGTELGRTRAASPLHQRRSLSRALTTFEMSLIEIDAARRRLGATNNDMVLAIVSGALHRWHTAHGADVKELRALVPVSLRDGPDGSAGNRIALLAMDLPIGEPNPVRRLRIIQARMGEVKADRRATLYPILASALTRLPLVLATEVGRQQTFRTNLVCTNVPGPRETCYLAGATIEAIFPYAPLVGDHPVAIALYSYRDTIHVGLDVDPLAMDDVPRFLDAFGESYAEVVNVGRHAELGGG